MLPPGWSSKMRHFLAPCIAANPVKVRRTRVYLAVRSGKQRGVKNRVNEHHRLHDRLRGTAFVSFASPSTSGTRRVWSWFETAFITGQLSVPLLFTSLSVASDRSRLRFSLRSRRMHRGIVLARSRRFFFLSFNNQSTVRETIVAIEGGTINRLARDLWTHAER